MDLSIRMRIIYNVKHRYVIRLKFGDKFLIFQTKLVLEGNFIGHRRRSDVFIVNFEHNSDLFLVFLLLTLNK